MPGPAPYGFTLIEVMVVVSVVSVLVAIMVPMLGKVKESARSVQCRSNLRQMGLMAAVYVEDHKGSYPVAQRNDPTIPAKVSWEITTLDPGGTPTYIPGELWSGQGTIEIQQCPSFDGPDNWTDAPYSGYNYNTSYIGHGQGEDIEEPAKVSHIRNPSQTVLFGDGGYSGGANKFMRSPLYAPGDAGVFSTGRYAGTQAFRHAGHTNAAFCDGHADSFNNRHTNIDPASEASSIAPGTGFLSPDNSLYDLD